MKTRKESIIQLTLAISGWATKRGRAYLNGNNVAGDRADKIIDYWIKHLEDFIKNQNGIETNSKDRK